jgi:hypothetical protein
MIWSARFAAILCAAAFAVAGCSSGGSASTSAGASTTSAGTSTTSAGTSTTSAAPQASSSPSSVSASTSSGALGPAVVAPPPVAGVCSGGSTKAVIGGAEACLAPGQICRAANSNDYPTYGFLCLQKGAEYILYKK